MLTTREGVEKPIKGKSLIQLGQRKKEITTSGSVGWGPSLRRGKTFVFCGRGKETPIDKKAMPKGNWVIEKFQHHEGLDQLRPLLKREQRPGTNNGGRGKIGGVGRIKCQVKPKVG